MIAASSPEGKTRTSPPSSHRGAQLIPEITARNLQRERRYNTAHREFKALSTIEQIARTDARAYARSRIAIENESNSVLLNATLAFILSTEAVLGFAMLWTYFTT